MNNTDSAHHNATGKRVSSELTPEQKIIIENKLQNALLKVLIKNGGEVVLLKSQTNKPPTDSR